MFDYQNQPGAPKPPRMSRVNWTQTTTITVAAFVGCLMAMATAVLLYKYMVGKAIRAKQAELDMLNNRVDDATYTLAHSKPTAKKPASNTYTSRAANVDIVDEPKTGTVESETEDESAENEKAYVPKPMPGEAIETTPAV